MAGVPTYTADGRRFCSYSLEAIERLLRLSKIVVQRNRRNAIVAAYFRHPDGANPVSKSPHLGMHYSSRKRVGQARLWQHEPLISPSELIGVEGTPSREEAEQLLIEAFLGVPLSVLASSDERISSDERKKPLCSTSRSAVPRLQQAASMPQRETLAFENKSAACEIAPYVKKLPSCSR
jgi:hypothetical protein